MTGEAAALVRRLTGILGLVGFDQPCGRCDGSAPTCFQRGVTAPEEVRFIIGMGILTELEPTVLEA
ncbi:MAG: hypothetical protein ACJ710_11390 [Ornithinibacter sp.]